MDLNKLATIIIMVSAVLVAFRTIIDIATKLIKRPKQEIENIVDERLEEYWKENSNVFMVSVTETKDENEYILRVLQTEMAISIERIYYLGVEDEELSAFQQECVNKYYEIYKKLGGNGHIEHLVNKMHSWKISPARKEMSI